MSTPAVVRAAEPTDVAEMRRLIVELAVYEKEPDAVKATEADLARALFGDSPAVFAFVVDGDEPGELAGLALWFLTFSTWEGVHGIHLEDLYVAPAHRGRGLGTALLARLADEAVARGLARVEWAVLDWNEPSIGFYRALGAASMDDWTTFRLDGAALAEVARTS